MAKLDSAASQHYFMEKDKFVLEDVHEERGPPVELPNSKFLQSNQQGKIPISEYLTPTAQNVMILKGLNSSSLISLGQLCDDGCIIGLHKKCSLQSKTIK